MSESTTRDEIREHLDQFGGGGETRRNGYFRFLSATCGHSLILMARRQRLIPLAGIVLLPALIPLAMAFFAETPFASDGAKIFVRLVEEVHINLFGPLLALFFAALLIGEDIESQTISYALTRPMPRSALVIGRFLAFVILASALLMLSACLTFGAAVTLDNLSLSLPDIRLLLHYCGVALAGVTAYGAVAIFLGAGTRRPVLLGVLIFYMWQKLAMIVPGLIDFITIQKYTSALLPALPEQRLHVEIQTALGTFQKEVFLVSAGKGLLILLGISSFFLAATILIVRRREYTAARSLSG